MIRLKRTDSTNPDFQQLVAALNKELLIRDGDDHDFYAQFNKIDMIKHVVVAYLDNQPAGCGAFKEYQDKTVEIKRMFVAPEHRGNGIASLVLTELENWCRELRYEKCILETGLKQPEAIRLYEKNTYSIIPNFGQYADVPGSVCFEKDL